MWVRARGRTAGTLRSARPVDPGVSRDSSLTDFASPDGSDDASGETVDEPTFDASDDSAAAGSNDAADPGTSNDDDAAGGGEGPTPARSTYEWTPDGAACAACGERTTRRWRLDDEPVCPDCKTW